MAVVFATSGFSRDVEYRSIENPRLKCAHTPSNLGQTAGVNPVQVSLSRFSFGIPTEDLIYGIIVDKNAQRFMNEDRDHQVLSNKILAHMDNLKLIFIQLLFLILMDFQIRMIQEECKVLLVLERCFVLKI
ncbi:hypothetical protein [Campylobacter novaezeelandiae]|uniref:hypothetical protein n=1 Tax=Campylobacter novaezeelandiae TaxID=2267891 RepID=UPI001FD176BA|nr:hypothetical protein [Campylobacter novaezeelandiae]